MKTADHYRQKADNYYNDDLPEILNLVDQAAEAGEYYIITNLNDKVIPKLEKINKIFANRKKCRIFAVSFGTVAFTFCRPFSFFVGN